MDMSKSDFSYKKYSGSVEYSIEDSCLFGRVLHIDDQIIYEGDTISDLKQAFECAVDEYLAYCKATGKDADKTYSGTFNIRTGSDLHRKAVVAARLRDLTLNEYIVKAIEASVDRNGLTKVEHTHSHEITIRAIGQTATHLATMTKPSGWGGIDATQH